MKIQPNIPPKTVLITGISRGIGEALAEKYLSESYKVIGTSIDGVTNLSHKNLEVHKLDLSVPESINDFVKIITDSDIKIDILHNNAGVMLDNIETHVKIENLKNTLNINLIGTIDLTEKLIQIINKGGHIVNTTSAAGSLTDEEYADDPNDPHHIPLYKVTRSAQNPYLYPSYKISKCAMNMYTCILAELLKHEQRDITVSAVHPGWVRTDMGGPDAPMLPSEAAKYIYELAVSHPETGQFWFKGEKYPW